MNTEHMCCEAGRVKRRGIGIPMKSRPDDSCRGGGASAVASGAEAATAAAVRAIDAHERGVADAAGGGVADRWRIHQPSRFWPPREA